jgi:hypothetical protein
MARNLITCVGLFMVAGFTVQPAHAGDRKADLSHPGVAAHHLVFAVQARSSGDNNVAARSVRVQGRGDLPFLSVSPFESRLTRFDNRSSAAGTSQKEKGPTTPAERKTITLFRLDPKFGDVSVQPVVGGVNGAQVAVGF